MDIQTLLVKHAAGGFECAFQNSRGSASCMTGYIVHDTDPEQGYVKSMLVHGACHAAVSSSIKREKALAVITMADNTLVNNEGAIKFYDWLINKSFFSDVFLCKDPVLSLKYGFVKQIDVSAAKWLGAAQLCRLSTSEFKVWMHAVYDILASDFDIHPMLLVVLATELCFTTDKKVIKATRAAKLQSIASSFYCANSSHLPLAYVNHEKILKDICKDDPTKPIEAKYLGTFREGRWPNNSNGILTKETLSTNVIQNSLEISEALKSLTKGNPSMLFNLTEAMLEVPYQSIWESAITELKSYVYSNLSNGTNGEGVPINLTGIELFSKKLNLGA
jgi:hypothetical protein